eukprot:m.78440 g.78440  ORF g.78440 m.78440 type:complete len:382 (-) comp14503_c0_seq7:1384-2529(-)
MVEPQEVVGLPFEASSDVELVMDGGGGHTVIAQGCELYTCGWNQCGQCGQPSSQPSLLRFLHVNTFPTKVNQVACGWDFTLVLLNQDHNNLLACGSNRYSQLGLKDVKATGTFQTVAWSAQNCAKAIAAGMRHSALIDASDGCLYTFGTGKHGQLGLGSDIIHAATPSQVCIPQVLLNAGDETAAGAVANGLPTTTAPTNPSWSVSHLSVGSHHTCVVDSIGRLWTCGRNTFGQVTGLRGNQRHWQWYNIGQWPVDDVVQLQCGWSHTLVMLRSGEVHGWGRANYGQLGQEQVAGEDALSGVQQAVLPDKAVELAVGTEHALCCTETGDVYGFGWNEHGNIGDGTEVDVHIPIRLPFASSPGVQVACGGGHSIVLIKTVKA